MADAVLGSCPPIHTAITARRGPRGHCSSGEGKWGRGEENRVLELPCPVFEGDQSRWVSGHRAGLSAAPSPPPWASLRVLRHQWGTDYITAPAGSHTERTSVCSDCAQTVPAPIAFHQGRWDHASWVDFEELRSCGFLQGEASAPFPRSSPRGQDCGESQGQGPRLARRPCPQGGQRGSGFGAPRVRVRGPPTGVLSVPTCASSVGRPAVQTRTLLRGKGPSWNDGAQHRGTGDGGHPRQQGGQSRLSLGVQVPRRGVDGDEVLRGREVGSWDQALRPRLGGGWAAAGRLGVRLLGC